MLRRVLLGVQRSPEGVLWPDFGRMQPGQSMQSG